MLWRAIFFTKSCINLNGNLPQKHSHRNTHNNVLPNIWVPHVPTKLTHKINHYITVQYFADVPTVLEEGISLGMKEGK